MTIRSLANCAAMLLSSGGLLGACGDTISAKDCTGSCQDADNTCIEKCYDDQCRTACKPDLDNCTASCSSSTAFAAPAQAPRENGTVGCAGPDRDRLTAVTE